MIVGFDNGDGAETLCANWDIGGATGLRFASRGLVRLLSQSRCGWQKNDSSCDCREAYETHGCPPRNK
ncbi:hypothetical protein SPHINGOAX6_40325 [Sphingomonas sp. AX6]|nr:hypothetical protein SPHINGOAX6_40325 [Sphingomonas sp. AX6]